MDQISKEEIRNLLKELPVVLREAFSLQRSVRGNKSMAKEDTRTFTSLKFRKSNRLQAALVTFTYTKQLTSSHIPHFSCLVS